MLSAVVARRLGPDRGRAATLAGAAVAGCALLAVVDPNEPGRYPLCPTAALFGLDCPACGTLRGLHSLTRGRIVEALDHNLLLLVAVPLGAWAWVGLVRQAQGRPWTPPALPRWGLPVLAVLLVVFAVVRNLGLAGLTWLDSAA
ncbi:MAG TPA: DUF2752 domain-containing protein [Acidimicrobiales bacterium]|nr:DUF2752 domain-containing protein [Acidimicrobiales bacterium]